MSKYQELIKSTDKTRKYVRDFFLYGFKSREEFDNKSPRTYDNERRRIESWFKDYIKTEYASNGKNISIVVNSRSALQNPLHRIWKSKSFTDNDLILHFYILEIFQKNEERSVTQVTNILSMQYGIIIEDQTVRNKLKQYEGEGILCARKEKKQILYKKNLSFNNLVKDVVSDFKMDVVSDYKMDLISDFKLDLVSDFKLDLVSDSESYFLSDSTPDCTSKEKDSLQQLQNMISFYTMTLCAGVIGSTILDEMGTKNDLFWVKHANFAHTLEDKVALDLLNAIRQQRKVTLTLFNRCQEKIKSIGIPLKILTSTRNGRRYICLLEKDNRRYKTVRLDNLYDVKLEDPVEKFEKIQSKFEGNLQKTWGVTFGTFHGMDHVQLLIRIHLPTEDFILQRLKREGKHGTITNVGKDLWQYEICVFDGSEMLPWIRTFTGRIVSLETNNQFLTINYHKDMKTMFQLYQIGED